MKKKEVAQWLREKADQYNHPEFIYSDPIQIPRAFSKKEDIEIAGFMAAAIAWGQRITIINNARKLMELMDNAPHDFITQHEPQDLQGFEGFVHRTFNADDAITFVLALRHLYAHHGGLEGCIAQCFDAEQSAPGSGWARFKERFFEIEHLPRTRKHLPNPMQGSAAKRMSMYLRWMVRQDAQGVDFGIWTQMKPSELYIPLDVHTARVARKLGLLKRKQNDWRAVLELTEALRTIEPEDPVRLDYALFGLGVFEKF